MPPKKAKAATTVQTKGLAKLAPASLGALPADLYDPNATWHKMISEAIQVIKDCPVFGEDICSAKPLPLTGDADTLTGFQAPFDETVFMDMTTQNSTVDPFLKKGHTAVYSCGINALWCDPLRSLTPGVPLLPRAIEKMMTTMFPQGAPRAMEQRVEIQAPLNGKVPFGTAVRVSPEETQHALIVAISRAIAESKPETELIEWKRVLLSCPGAFVMNLETADDLYFHVTNLRSKVEATSRAISHKASQIIFDVYNYKLRKELVLGPLSAKAVAQYYIENCTSGEDDDSATGVSEDRGKVTTIEHAITVYEKIFKQPVLLELILDFERNMLDKSPFNSIYKLKELVVACKAQPLKIEWVIKTIKNRISAKTMDASEISVRSLTSGGAGSPKGRNWAEVFVKQREIRNYLLGTFMDTRTVVVGSDCMIKRMNKQRGLLTLDGRCPATTTVC
jgi:hypothetical protein